jgi:hypothetical protein
VDSFFILIERSAFSTWLRESPSLLVFPTVLIFHTVGMGFLAGTNIGIDLRILGFASGMRIAPMRKFFPIMWLGFFMNAISGILLLIAYPTKALTNWVFYAKLIAIAAALIETRMIKNHVFDDPHVDQQPVTRKAKILAATSILLWAGAITAGRLLAYTYVRLMTPLE